MRSLTRLTRSLKKAHSSLLEEQNKKKHVETCNVDLTCDIINESLSMFIIVPLTNFFIIFSFSPHIVMIASLMMSTLVTRTPPLKQATASSSLPRPPPASLLGPSLFHRTTNPAPSHSTARAQSHARRLE